MSGAQSNRRSVRCSPLAIAAASALACAALRPATALAQNTPDYVTGTDLTAAGSFSAGLPTVANDVITNASSPTALTLNGSTSTANLNAGTLDDTHTGITTTINNAGTGGNNIYLGGSGSAGNGVSANPADLLYVAGATGTVFNVSSTGGHSDSIVLEQSGNFNVGTGSAFNYTVAASGSLNLNGFTLTTTGGGTQNYGLITGTTTAGTVVVAGAATVGGPGVLGAGEVSFNSNNTYKGTTTINSGSVLAINATATETYGATGSTTDNGTLVLGVAAATTLTFSTPITGTGSVLFQHANGTSGVATLIISGSNSYSGGTTIGNSSTSSSGTVQISNGASLGTGTVTIVGQTTVVNALQFSGGITLPNAINLQGLRSANVSEIVSAADSNTLSGTITLTSGGAQYANVNNSAAGTLLTLSGNLVNNVSGTGLRTFDLRGTGNFMLTGTIGSGTNPSTSVEQDTTGTVTLTGSNTYTQGTNITAGTLVAAAAATGGTPLGTGAVTDAKTLQFSPGSGITQTVAGAISGAGVVTHTGAGTTILSNNNSYGGGTTLSAGTLQANGTTSTLGTALATINGGTLAGGTSTAAGATGGGGVSLAGGTLTGGTGATTSDKVGTLVVGTAATATAAVTLNGSGIAYAAKVDPSLVSGTGTSQTTVNSPSTPVTVYAAASDELIVSNFTSGTASVLTVNPMVTMNASGGAGPLSPSTSYYFLIANATGASPSNLSGFLSQFTLPTGSTYTDTSGNSYSLDAAPDSTSGDDLLLDLTTAAAPEPTSLLLAGAAAIPLTLGRRRRSWATARS